MSGERGPVTTRRTDPARGSRTPSRVEGFLAEAARTVGAEGLESLSVAAHVAAAPDPESCALGLVRIAEAVERAGLAERFVSAARADLHVLSRLCILAGGSEACVDFLVRDPEAVFALADPDETLLLGTEASSAEAIRAHLFSAVGADPESPRAVAACAGDEARTVLRRAYRSLLIRLLVDDLGSADPAARVLEVTRVLSDMAAGVLDAALTVARAEVPGHESVALSVIGMGKCGARELNYVSDVDIVLCYAEDAEYSEDEQGEDASVTRRTSIPEAGARIATDLSNRIVEIISAPGAEPALWEVDTALRPEGKAGPLVRTLPEFVHYYSEVAHNWEFQALLKARPLAGDAGLGARWHEEIHPFVWTASGRPDFISQARAMRRRVVDLIPEAEASRQLKLGPGGLRDVEFSAQLLQLVHGLDEEQIRVPTTLLALAELGECGYIGLPDSAELSASYRFMRVVEHRMQIPRMQRTAVLPVDETKLRVLARSVYSTGERSAVRLTEELGVHAKRVRSLHEQIFYRPILQAAAGQTSITRLSSENARARLAAFGYHDTKAAMGHIVALTQGVNRAARVQTQVLPAMLDWFAAGVDPDAALLAFRRLSDSLSTSTWYRRLLRESTGATKSLAHVLSLSEYATGLLLTNPTATQWLDEVSLLSDRPAEVMSGELRRIMKRQSGADLGPIRSFHTREILRIALADVLEAEDRARTPGRLSALMDVSIDAALEVVRTRLDAAAGITDYDFLVVAMGRLGGAEIGYFSDADVLFVYRPRDPVIGTDASAALAGHVKKIAMALTAELGARDADLPIELDADLRPEGRSGPLVRSLASYEKYYAKWSEPWEAQALLRARPIAGEEDLREDFLALVDPLRYPAEVPESSLRQMRRLKARMEGERLPRNADPKRHLKLGRGGLSDVEWTVQLLQLMHAHEHPELRTTSTLPALRTATRLGLIDEVDAQILAKAWSLATEVRSAVMLYRGRTAESLPADRSELEATARLMGYRPDNSQRLLDDYLGSTRRARAVVERVFFDFD